jgi:hypothetical protein
LCNGSPCCGSCFNGVCLPGLIYLFCSKGAEGAACANADDCCSENCFQGACVLACIGTGSACTVNTECCSRLCHNGKCAFATCGAAGSTCTANSSCCSDKCNAGLCQ